MTVIKRRHGRLELNMKYIQMGLDACLVITGGDRPHLGAIAVAQVRESLETPEKLSSTVSNITLPGHKEDMLARALAARLAVVTSANVVVCCGIHVDDISSDEIHTVVEMCNQMLDEIIENFDRQ